MTMRRAFESLNHFFIYPTKEMVATIWSKLNNIMKNRRDVAMALGRKSTEINVIWSV